MREIFTHRGLARKTDSDFAGVSAKNAVGIIRAKEISETRLTAREIQVKFADCPRTKTKTTTY
jgi:hypothetical protein